MRTQGFPESFTHELPRPREFARTPSEVVEVTFTRLISPAAIATRRLEVAKRMAADYKAEKPRRPPIFVIGLLSAAKFGLELAEDVYGVDNTIEPQIETMRYRSRRHGNQSAVIRNPDKLAFDPGGRHVVLIDNILSTGRALQAAYRHIRSLRPASLAIACLLERQMGVQNLIVEPTKPNLDRPWVPSREPLKPDPILVNYACFDTNSYVAGYGLDLGDDGRARLLPGIFAPDHPEFPRNYGNARILGLHPSMETGPNGQLETSWAGNQFA